MSSKKYESGQLNSILNSLFKQKTSGILNLETQVDSWQNQRSCILILQQGALVYGDINISQPPNNKQLCKMLGEELNPGLINAALSVASEKIGNFTSIKESVGLLCRMRVFTWQEVETFIANKVILILERFLPYPGIAQWQESRDFDLYYDEDNHGLNWSEIKKQLVQRQQKWESYVAHIPDMNAIPVVTAQQKQIGNSQIIEHLKNSVDGKATLIDIADKMTKDPLKVAKNYFDWANNDWVKFVQTPMAIAANQTASRSQPSTPAVDDQSQDRENLPIVLSVDDSPIIQTSIKRALQDQYNVLLADKAIDALVILNQQPVKLLLLDLTMPDIDGLQFCKTVRQITKFKDLPIIMVTARDGLLNKAKGHIAGTNKYLTKPFEPDELREVVRQYISN